MLFLCFQIAMTYFNPKSLYRTDVEKINPYQAKTFPETICLTVPLCYCIAIFCLSDNLGNFLLNIIIFKQFFLGGVGASPHLKQCFPLAFHAAILVLIIQ